MVGACSVTTAGVPPWKTGSIRTASGVITSLPASSPYGTETFAVKGHIFGLDLSAEDRKALIAFLKTL